MHLLTNEYIKWNTHAAEYCLAIKINELFVPGKGWENFKNIMLCEKKEKQKALHYIFSLTGNA